MTIDDSSSNCVHSRGGRKRSKENKNLPLNLYVSSKDGRNYYRYRHPITKKEHGMGGNRANAIKAAMELNDRLYKRIITPTEKLMRRAEAHGRLDDDGLLELDSILENAMPPTICGVYFLLKGQEIVYVGQSVNVYLRLANHKIDSMKDWDTFFVHRTAQEHLEQLESMYILKFRPRYNMRIPDSCMPNAWRMVDK